MRKITRSIGLRFEQHWNELGETGFIEESTSGVLRALVLSPRVVFSLADVNISPPSDPVLDPPDSARYHAGEGVWPDFRSRASPERAPYRAGSS